MDLRALMLFLGFCSSVSPAEYRLVGGPSPCSGRLEQQHQSDWKPVRDQNRNWNRNEADEVCRRISCGSVVSLSRTLDQEPPEDLVTKNDFRAEGTPEPPPFRVEITCSDSVRLVDGTYLCSGRLQVKRNQVWSSVCSDGFDQQDADVVCRELGCGYPSRFEGEVYGEAPEWNTEFQCGGHESTLLHCDHSDRDTCSNGTTVTLTCSDPVRLVGGSGRCDGTLKVRSWGEWRPVDDPNWDLWSASMVCNELDCGSAVSTRRRVTGSKDTWRFKSDCEDIYLFLCEPQHQTSSGVIEITCSDSVRLGSRFQLCSGILQVRRNQVWSLVCSDGFDQQDADVVCRELGCGSPSGFKGEVYGEAPEWNTEFQCGGHESALLHCDHSDRDTCSPGTTVTLTCSDPDDVRLVGGASRCAGRLEMKHDGVWRVMKMQDPDRNVMVASMVCRRQNCGAAISAVNRPQYPQEDAWWIGSSCRYSILKECVTVNHQQTSDSLEVTCSGDSVRLDNETHPCSGRLQVKRNQVWSSVCSDGFDQQDAEVVCRELDCGYPQRFKGEVYGEAPEWNTEFQCGGHESALLHCDHSDRDTCSPGTTVTLTCSGDMRLVGTNSTCAGELQMKVYSEWRYVVDNDWYQYHDWTSAAAAAAVCSQLGCGSVVASGLKDLGAKTPMWSINSSCLQRAVSLQDCLEGGVYQSTKTLQVICSDLLLQPNISVSPSHDEVQQQKVRVLLGSNFSIICSTRPQYPGGSFQLVFTSSSTTLDYVLPAVTHSAVFLFPAAEGLHRGTYTCIYHLNVFSHNFSSTSRPIYLIPSAPLMDLIIRLVVHLLVMILLISVTCFYSRKKTLSIETRSRNEETNVLTDLQ